MASVQLRDIASSGDRSAVMGLHRGPGQDRYLNSMEEIFAEADQEQRAMPHPWAVHDGQTGELVGFVMISDNIPQPMDDELPPAAVQGLIWHSIQVSSGIHTLLTETNCGPKNETTPMPTTIKHAIRVRIIAGQWRWRWDLNPRKTCAFTRFRVLRTTVHHRPPAFVTSADIRPAAAGERPRTGGE